MLRNDPSYCSIVLSLAICLGVQNVWILGSWSFFYDHDQSNWILGREEPLVYIISSLTCIEYILSSLTCIHKRDLVGLVI